ncbi:MAG: response regulator [Planctomycetota bacterium]|nr:MAG: response regulator [Planctomycetota bacterium]
MEPNPSSNQVSEKEEKKLSLKSKIIVAFVLIVAIWSVSFSILFRYILKHIILHQSLSQSTIQTILNHLTLSITGLTIAGGGIVLLIGYHFANLITRPVEELTHKVEEVAQGNLDAKVSVRSQDELGFLAQRFNEMGTALKSQRQKLLEQQQHLEEQKRQLEEISRYKSEFLANMSHELRTPLNATIGYLSLTLRSAKKNLSKPQLQNLLQAERSAKTLLQLINDVLDFSKIEAGKIDLFLEEFHLEEVIEEALLTAEGLLSNNNVKLKTQLDANLPPLESDYTKIEQILNNLLSNAIKFTKHGHILITATQPNSHHLLLTVEDTGCGIEEDKLENIFESFRQIDSSIKKRFGGTGLGLAITKRLCELLHIDLKVQSQVGKGTRFELSIPLKIQETLDNQKAKQPLHAPKKESPKDADPSQKEKIQTTAEPPGKKPSTYHKFSDESSSSPSSSQTPTASPLDIPRHQTHSLPLTEEIPIAYSTPTPSQLDLRGELLCFCTDATAAELRNQLKEMPLDIERISSLEECIQKSQKNPFVWAILLELEPENFEILRQVKSNETTQHIPVIMCTTKEQNTAASLGLVEYIATPIEKGKVLETLLRIDRQKKEILIVEDDDNLREMYRQLLLAEGYQCRLASNGKEALSHLESNPPPQGILLDLLMPQMDGFEFLEVMRRNSRWQSIPIIIITGKELSTEERTLLKKGTQYILEKSKFSPSEIDRHIRNIVQSIVLAHSYKILIIDDHEENLNLLESLFLEEGYVVYKSLSAKEGIEMAQKHQPHIVLMDLAMPEMDGFEATQILKRHPLTSHIVVIACTAFAMQSYRKKAYEVGCEGFITKPIEPERLIERIKKYVLIANIRRKLKEQSSL